jgi:hypothetical protein
MPGNLVFKEQKNPSKYLILKGAAPYSQVILDSNNLKLFLNAE